MRVQVEDFGMKLAHQFPWAPAAAVALGLALRRRFLSDPDTPSTVTRRLQVTKVHPPAVPPLPLLLALFLLAPLKPARKMPYMIWGICHLLTAAQPPVKAPSRHAMHVDTV